MVGNLLSDEMRLFMLYFLLVIVVIMAIAIFLMYLKLEELEKNILENQQTLLNNKNLIGNLSEDFNGK